MPIEIPSPEKIHTTVYDNFKGVDFTNDPSNVWRRRSPSGVNMLPDASGRPFKRYGWEVAISNAELCEALGVGTVKIDKCAYFTLGGIDYIIVFTDKGVLSFWTEDVGDEQERKLVVLSTDMDCFSSLDRCFFFDGNGISAFYIYGKDRIWVYKGKEDFAEATDTDYFIDSVSKVVIPRVLISANPETASGEILEAYNLVGKRCAVEYQNNNVSGTYKTYLPNNVGQGQLADVEVYVSTNTQFDTQLDVVDQNEDPTSTSASLRTDANGTYLLYNSLYEPVVDGEDAIRVIFPSAEVTVTTKTQETISGGSTTLRR